MIQKVVVTFFVLLCGIALTAHEFWLQPQKFRYDIGEIVNLRFCVGENFEGENWTGTRAKIQSLQLHLADMTDDLSGYISDENKGDSLQLALYDEGTAMITYRSANTFITLEPEKFLAYLKEDGLQNAIDYRQQHNEVDSVGQEYYQRSVKTLLQVADKKDDFVTRLTKLPLDIVPAVNPYKLQEGDTLNATIYFERQPVANQLIKVWHRVNGRTFKQTFTTDEQGRIHFPVTLLGKYMISTVKMARLQTDERARWQSYWGSCTWGYE